MYNDETILKAAFIYAHDLFINDSSILKTQLRIWRCQWKNKKLKPDLVSDTLAH